MGIEILMVTQHLSTSPSYFHPKKCLSANFFPPPHKSRSSLGLLGEAVVSRGPDENGQAKSSKGGLGYI